MSLLDIIKNLFCGKKCEKPEAEQINDVAAKPEIKPEPNIAPKTEAEAKPKSTPAPVTSSAPKKEKAIEPQIPEDSALRRHYLANLEAEKQPKEVKATDPVEKKATVSPPPKVIEASKKPAVELQIPQDATLKRHFISALKTKIEADMPARPTDSALKRHYDAAVQTELDKLLN